MSALEAPVIHLNVSTEDKATNTDDELELSGGSPKLGDPNNSTQSMYFSVNNETMTNNIADELIKSKDLSPTALDKTLTPEIAPKQEEKMEEEKFKTNLEMKFVQNVLEKNLCSTPKLTPRIDSVELVVPSIIVTQADKIDENDKKLEKEIINVVKKVTISEPVQIKDKKNKENQSKLANTRQSIIPKPSSSMNAPIRKSFVRKSLIPKSNPAPSKAEPKLKKSPLIDRKEIRKSNRVFHTVTKSIHRYTLSTRPSSPAVKKSPAKKSTRVSMSFAAPLAPVSKTIAKKSDAEKTNATSENAKRRQSKIPTTGSSVSKSSSLQCHICSKKFSFQTSLKAHLKVHDSKAVHFICAYCDREFEKEIGLKNHLERYCQKVPVAEKRKLDISNDHKDRPRAKMEKNSSRQESSSSLLSSDDSASHSRRKNLTSVEKEPTSAIKSIRNAHSGIKIKGIKLNSAEPYRCIRCRLTFSEFKDFINHTENGGTCQKKKE